MKVFLFIIPLFILFSCKSERTCTCSDGQVVKITATKNEAKSACAKLSDDIVECHL